MVFRVQSHWPYNFRQLAVTVLLAHNTWYVQVIINLRFNKEVATGAAQVWLVQLFVYFGVNRPKFHSQLT